MKLPQRCPKPRPRLQRDVPAEQPERRAPAERSIGQHPALAPEDETEFVCEQDETTYEGTPFRPEEETPFFGELDEAGDAAPSDKPTHAAETDPKPIPPDQFQGSSAPPLPNPCATAQTKVTWDLPEVLGEYGRIARQLENTKWLQDPKSSAARESGFSQQMLKLGAVVHQIITRNRYSLQITSRQQTWTATEKMPCERFLDKTKDTLDNGDPVFAWTVLHILANRQPSQTIIDNAREWYTAGAEVYDLILDDAIPPMLREMCSANLANRRFRDGSHATAKQDWDALRHTLQETKAGLTTGLPMVDRLLGGGFSDVTVIGADEGDGKTSFALHAVIAAMRANEDLGCLYFVLDEPKQDTLKKLYSLATEKDFATLDLPERRRSDEDNTRIKQGEAELTSRLLPRMKFLEGPNLEPVFDCDRLLRWYSRFQRDAGFKRGVLVVDMFQSLSMLPDGIGTENERDEYRLDVLQKFRLATRSTAEPKGVPIIATSEVRKSTTTALKTNDLRGSARIGSVPAKIILLWPPEQSEQSGPVVNRVLRVAKARGGHEGTLTVQFHHMICKFTEQRARPAAGKPTRR
jgi:replicative DNA helicase